MVWSILSGHLAAVSCAAALTLAGILALAAIVAGLAAALALAGVLAFTSVFFFSLLAGIVARLSAGRSQAIGNEIRSLNAGASGEQTRKSRTRE